METRETLPVFSTGSPGRCRVPARLDGSGPFDMLDLQGKDFRDLPKVCGAAIG